MTVSPEVTPIPIGLIIKDINVLPQDTFDQLPYMNNAGFEGDNAILRRFIAVIVSVLQNTATPEDAAIAQDALDVLVDTVIAAPKEIQHRYLLEAYIW